jgi:hypothetical protein
MAEQFEDETIFPSKVDAPFPKNFFVIIKTMFKKCFRCELFQFLQVTIKFFKISKFSLFLPLKKFIFEN